ncbi:MAG: hypothetical protein QHI38_01855 [Armatimonadota bacterium]|nr:hypothetical protein [Armatimonadota bacterium]
MRAAVCVLCLAILGLMVFALLCFVTSSLLPQKQFKPRQTVYVDVGVLEPLHPCFKLLREWERFTALSPINVGKAAGTGWFSLPLSATYVQPPAVDRKDLVAETALTAVGEFSRLEARQRDALAVRLQRIRSTFEASVEPELAAEIKELEREFAAKEKDLIAQHAEQMRKVELRISALRSALEHVKTVLTPLKRADSNSWLSQLERDLEEAIAEQKRLNTDLAQRTAALRAELSEKISQLRRRKGAEVENRLAEIETAERTRIEAAIADARNEVFSGLWLPEEVWQTEWSGYGIGASVGSAPAVVVQPTVYRHGFSRAGKVAQAMRSIRAIIRKDLAEQVRRIAAQNGLRVTFVAGAGVRDATEDFRRWLLRSHDVCWGPVLSAALR